ncbi:MAG: phosphorylcholine transferase LicD [Lachnospiraceae bacterium]
MTILSDDFYQEEERCGYLVTNKMKKVWATEIELWQQFDKVCKRYGLKYYAAFGTLLGAVRHQGFIPWDDDMDFWMLRDEYEKFKEIAPKEFTGKYYYQNWYNSSGMTWIFSKIRNSETTAVEFPQKEPGFNQGIFIDIFPIDEFDDGVHVNPVFKQIQRELFDCINNPLDMLRGVLAGKQYAMGTDLVVELANDYIKAQHLFDQLTLENYGQSDIVGYYYDEVRSNARRYPKSVFGDTIYMDFEGLKMPVPAGYDLILKKYYDDYMTPVHVFNNHEQKILLDPDKPYVEYLENT